MNADANRIVREVVDATPNTVLYYAELNNHAEMVAMLRGAGAQGEEDEYEDEQTWTCLAGQTVRLAWQTVMTFGELTGDRCEECDDWFCNWFCNCCNGPTLLSRDSKKYIKFAICSECASPSASGPEDEG